jgi:hypothetical protein
MHLICSHGSHFLQSDDEAEEEEQEEDEEDVDHEEECDEAKIAKDEEIFHFTRSNAMQVSS